MFYHYLGGFWLSYQDLRTMRLMHFPFEVIIWDTKVFLNLHLMAIQLSPGLT
jgi:hypothetical protein